MICDHSDFRLEKAKGLGFAVCNNSRENLQEAAISIFGTAPSRFGPTANVPIYIDAAGAESILELYQSMGKIESRMVVVAVRAGKRPVDVLEMTYSQHALIGSGGYNPEDVEDVIAGIQAALDYGFNPVKINAVVVRSLNQDVYEFAKMSVDRPLHMRFIEYMPVGDSAGYDGMGWGKQDVVPCEELIETINARAISDGLGPLKPAGGHRPSGWGPARYYEFEGAKGTVGFISPLSRHFCSECNRLRLTADGKIRPCLFSDRELDLRGALRNGTDADIRAVFLEAIGIKPDDHHDKVGTERGMSKIGG